MKIVFLSTILILMVGAKAYDTDNSVPPPAPMDEQHSWTCDTLRGYLVAHTKDEARAEAVKLHLPKWFVKKAEACSQ